MQTLFDKVMQDLIEPADAADIALSLTYLIEEQNQALHIDPANIVIGDDNRVSIVPGQYPVDCLYAAPEVALTGTAASKESMWFSLGCLLFFMLNKRTYHEIYDLNPFEQAELHPGTSLVDMSRYDGLAADAISALTSWNPYNRAQGVGLLLQLAERVPSRAVVRYSCNGQIVATEEIPLTESLDNFRAGETITDSCQKSYTVRSGAVIPFRPGTHPVTVVVDHVSAVPNQPQFPNDTALENVWLVVTFPFPDNSGRTVVKKLLPLNESAQNQMIPISTTVATKYDFYAVTENSATKKIVSNRQLFYLQIPAIPSMKRAKMNIRYHVEPKGFSVEICDENSRPISNAKHFKMI